MGRISRASAVLTFALFAALGLGSRSGGPLYAQSMGDMVTAKQSTASYTVELDIGPQATMLTPDQAAGATAGEVMVDPSAMSSMGMGGMAMGGMAMGGMAIGGMPMSGMPMSGMPMGGMPMGGVAGGAAPMNLSLQAAGGNHHVEVHVFNTMTGDVVSDMMPSISIVNMATGARVGLDSIMAMYDLQVGQGDLHFGNNAQLDPGAYMVTVTVGSESTTFNNVVVGT
jgi:hypothetical protein